MVGFLLEGVGGSAKMVTSFLFLATWNFLHDPYTLNTGNLCDRTAAMGFPLQDKITGGYQIK